MAKYKFINDLVTLEYPKGSLYFDNNASIEYDFNPENDTVRLTINGYFFKKGKSLNDLIEFLESVKEKLDPAE